MNKFDVQSVTDKKIVLRSSKDLESVYDLIDTDENFILSWTEEGNACSQLIIATNISSGVKNGEIILSSIEDSEVKKC